MRTDSILKYPPKIEDLKGESLVYFEIPSVIAIHLDGEYATLTITSRGYLVCHERILKFCITCESLETLFELLDIDVARRIIILAKSIQTFSEFSIREI